MDAANEQAVTQRLASMGYSLKAVIPATGQGISKAARPSAATRATGGAGYPITVQSCIPFNALTRFYRQLATYVRSGMPLIQSLNELQNTTSNRKLRRVCEELRSHAQSGGSLSSILAPHSNIFPAHTIGLIWAGEIGGYLDIALEEAASELEQERRENLLSRIGWGIFKINLFLFILCLPVLSFNKLLLATMNPSNQSLPGVLGEMGRIYTQGFVKYSIPAFIFWIIFAFVWGRVKRIPSVRRAFDGILLAVPIWGKLHKTRAIERFLRTLYRQYQAAIAPAQAWAAASTTVRNSELASRLRSLDEMLRTPSGNLQTAFIQSKVFSLDDAGMIATGEKSGSVPEMLQRLADFHKDEAANTRNFGRLASVIAFNLSWIIPTGLSFIMVYRGYGKFLMDLFKEAF
jgi:type IV pilus assembly protein PilC